MRSAFVVMIAVLGIHGCRQSTGTGSEPANVSDPPDADATTGGPVSCELMDGACGPSEACCSAHIVGMRFDFERACLSGEREILACRTKPDGGVCVVRDAYDCWTKESSDGGVDVYFTPNNWLAQELPDYERCDAELQALVFSRSGTTCP
jgi:hypothetical protein